jgi:FkbM family methyltransferase
MFLGRRFTTLIVRPYIRFELPAWGRVYATFIGDYKNDSQWNGIPPIWTRGKLHGYEMLLDLSQWSNRATYFLGRLYDLPTQLAMKSMLQTGDTFVDIGANEGHISLLGSSLVGTTGKVIAFEPNPAPRSVFQSMIDRNRIKNIELIPIGLSDSDDKLILSAPKINSGEGSFGRSNYPENLIDAVTCEVRRGDDRLAGETPGFIKIDVEGFELRVLRGLEKTISRHKPPIIMEMIASHLANADTKVDDVVTFMTGLGYEPFQIGLRRSGLRQKLDISPTTVKPDVEADILWMHPANRSKAEFMLRA